MQERPCTRCIKRNIGHLCHDEPREQVKRPKSEHEFSTGEDEISLKHEDPATNDMPQGLKQRQTGQKLLQESSLNLGQDPPILNRVADTLRPIVPSPVTDSQVHATKINAQHRESSSSRCSSWMTLADCLFRHGLQ